MQQGRFLLEIDIAQHAAGRDGLYVVAPRGFTEGEPQIVELDLADPALRGPLERIESGATDHEFFQSFGADLFERLFVGDVRQSYVETVARAEAFVHSETADASLRSARLRIRIVLRDNARQLTRLPWMLLYDPRARWLLSCTQSEHLSTPLSLCVMSKSKPRQPLAMPLRILLVAANPVHFDLEPIRHEIEFEAIQQKLEPFVSRGALAVREIEHATRETLRATIESWRPHVVHLICHGPESREVAEVNPHIVLERERRAVDRCQADLLHGLLEGGHGALRLVVINACNSDVVAWSLAQRGIPTLGMRTPVYGRAAERFGPVFYPSIAEGVAVDEAANLARKAIRTLWEEDNCDWFAPTLFLPIWEPDPLGDWSGVLAKARREATSAAPPPAPPIEVDPARPKKPAVEPRLARAFLLVPRFLWLGALLAPILVLLLQHAWVATHRYPGGMVRFPSGVFQAGGERTPLLDMMRRYAMVANLSLAIESPPEVVRGNSFWIDAREVTNADYQRFLRSGAAGRHQSHDRSEPEGIDHAPAFQDNPLLDRPDHPVVGVSWYDATAYCTWAGKRLPTGLEWERAARGTDARFFPWGNEFDASYANTASRIPIGPAAVGSFSRDRSPEGVHDLAGNVREWTSEGKPDVAAEAKVVRGGSWQESGEIVFLSFLRLGTLPIVREMNLGFRCASDDASGEKAEGMVRIPAGDFQVGSERSFTADLARRHRLSGMLLQKLIREEPAELELAEFALDAREVSNGQYRAFTTGLSTHEACSDEEHVKFPEGKSHDAAGWDSPVLRLPDLPVVGVDWYDAAAYCGSVGKRLPTAMEWERAARGRDGRRYPWGDEFRNDRCNTSDSTKGRGATVPVGSDASCVTDEGVADLSGNADEWTATPAEVAVEGDKREIRGGSWAEAGELRAVGLFGSVADAGYRQLDMGIRCAKDPERSWLERALGLL